MISCMYRLYDEDEGSGEARLPMVEAEEVKFSVEEPSVGILPVGAAARTEVNKIFSVGIPCLS